ncbi:hypothetical protein ZWY2020_030558 [Hordeum vulgare]|nr:hypothetical protein ZWY2020_030558 [Hordeum vulgare]
MAAGTQRRSTGAAAAISGGTTACKCDATGMDSAPLSTASRSDNLVDEDDDRLHSPRRGRKALLAISRVCGGWVRWMDSLAKDDPQEVLLLVDWCTAPARRRNF